MSEIYRPKEISWLSFNERLIQQAIDESIPLYERIKFLGIYSNNLDEFYRVRVATLKRLAKLKSKTKQIIGHNVSQTLKEIDKIVRQQNIYYNKAREKIKEELRKKNIALINETQVNKKDLCFIENFLQNTLQSSLIPIIFYEEKFSPNLKDDNIYLGLKITCNNTETPTFAMIKIPTEKIDRFIILPKQNNETRIIYLDDIIRIALPKLFPFIDIKKINAYAFKVTKDAELNIEDDISASYIELIDKSIKKRKKAQPVRFVYDKDMDIDLKKRLLKVFNIKKADTIIAGGRYHNSKDFMKFPDILPQKDKYKKWKHIKIKEIDNQKTFFTTLKKHDILLYFPYHSFNYLINFLKEAATDPFVKEINVTLYRLSKNSDIIDILLAAVQNGKNVTAVIELQARFDEKENVRWSKKLAEGGVKVINGVPGLKVHAKMTLITRRINGKKELYAAIGTGNYNETTAKLYTDIIILTANEKITTDVKKIFLFFNQNYTQFSCKHLIVSPFATRKKITKLIEEEIKNAKNGKKAYIYVKMNNIDDKQTIELLQKAATNNVKVILLVRGMFSLITEQKNFTENIKAYGIVDRFLEHARFLIFANNNDPKIYISSADLMFRNINRRIETIMPIYDKKIKKYILDIFEIYLNDNTAARILDKNLTNKINKNNKNKNRAQEQLYKYLSEIR